MNTAFDTLTAAKKLQDTGLNQRQAEAIALVVKNSQGNLVTIADLQVVKTELHTALEKLDGRIDGLEGRIDGLRDMLDSSIKNLNSRMDGFRWLHSITITGIVALFTSQTAMFIWLLNNIPGIQ
ncbi:MAG: hypothetical protein OXD01_06055 [Gammaproteobacteria bacterium]|nr:hypothetical protein [Gammaproteobacteria bacterium]